MLFALILLLASCAHVQPIEPCLVNAHIYGFWSGLWHGMICPITFIGSLFDHNIAVYAINNNGAWYNLGFVLAVGGFSSGITYRGRRNGRRH